MIVRMTWHDHNDGNGIIYKSLLCMVFLANIFMRPSTLHTLPAIATVFAGLVCGHADCGALFSNIEASTTHAKEKHSGIVLANTCGVREVLNAASGEVELALVHKDQHSWVLAC